MLSAQKLSSFWAQAGLMSRAWRSCLSTQTLCWDPSVEAQSRLLPESYGPADGNVARWEGRKGEGRLWQVKQARGHRKQSLEIIRGHLEMILTQDLAQAEGWDPIQSVRVFIHSFTGCEGDLAATSVTPWSPESNRLCGGLGMCLGPSSPLHLCPSWS